LGKQLTHNAGKVAPPARVTAAEPMILLAAQERLSKLGEVSMQAESPNPCR
jgi:hypothetical protein